MSSNKKPTYDPLGGRNILHAVSIETASRPSFTLTRKSDGHYEVAVGFYRRAFVVKRPKGWEVRPERAEFDVTSGHRTKEVAAQAFADAVNAAKGGEA